MDNVLISVIMANYNTSAEYLKEAINSILNQTFKNFELIIVDDASTDDSLSVIKSYQDVRIRIIENKTNLGLTKSLNKAMDICKGKYIARMDSDDISLPTRLEKQFKFMETRPDVIVCGSWFEKFGKEETVRKPVINDFELYRCQLLFSNTPITMCHPSVMIRKSYLVDNNIRYNENILKSQDYALWVECSKYGNFAILNEVLLRYRTHSAQISEDKQEEQGYFANLISRYQLQKLGIDYCKGENRWRYNIVTSKNDYLQFYDWLQDIIKNNKTIRLVDPEKLEEYCCYKLSTSLKRINRKDLIKIWFGSNQKTRHLIIGLIKNSLNNKTNG